MKALVAPVVNAVAFAAELAEPVRVMSGVEAPLSETTGVATTGISPFETSSFSTRPRLTSRLTTSSLSTSAAYTLTSVDEALERRVDRCSSAGPPLVEAGLGDHEGGLVHPSLARPIADPRGRDSDEGEHGERE